MRKVFDELCNEIPFAKKWDPNANTSLQTGFVFEHSPCSLFIRTPILKTPSWKKFVPQTIHPPASNRRECAWFVTKVVWYFVKLCNPNPNSNPNIVRIQNTLLITFFSVPFSPFSPPPRVPRSMHQNPERHESIRKTFAHYFSSIFREWIGFVMVYCKSRNPQIDTNHINFPRRSRPTWCCSSKLSAGHCFANVKLCYYKSIRQFMIWPKMCFWYTT